MSEDQKLPVEFDFSNLTEQQMRDQKVPFLDNKEDLSKFIQALVDRPHEYGTCVHAMSMAAVVAFNYVAKQLGCTGFQSSCADLDFIRRTRMIQEPFYLVTLRKVFYPQYNITEEIQEFIKKNKDWIREEAKRKMDTDDINNVHPEVWAHWQRLASLDSPEAPKEIEE